MKKRQSIPLKLSSIIIGVFILLFITYMLVTGAIIKNQNVADAEKLTLTTAEQSTLKMSERFKKASTTLITTKGILENLRNNNDLYGDDVLEIIASNLHNNEDIMGAGAVLERNSFEVDAVSAGRYVDSQGRFIPYLWKEEQSIDITMLNDLDDRQVSEWYWIPKEQKRMTLVEPYPYEVNGQIVPMTTVAVPLIDSRGNVFGALTADISIEFLNELIAADTPIGGYAAIVSNAGELVADSLGESGGNVESYSGIAWESIKQQIASGETASMYEYSQQLKDTSYMIFKPMVLEGIEEKWAVQFVLPESVILEQYNQIVWIAVISAVIIISVMALISIWYIFKQLRPLKYLRESMEAAASGNLTKTIDPKYIKPDEIGTVTLAYNNMIEQTSEIIKTVQNSTETLNDATAHVTNSFNEITASSVEVATAIDEIAQGTSKQSEDTEETNYRMMDLSDELDTLSSISNNMDELSKQTQETISNGMNEVVSLREHNAQTNNMNTRIQQQMHTLATDISNINNIIASIQGITEQTNLLALNASIEAARAGEHGKGFAVVAEEVRNLAEQSKKETEIIRETVAGILENSRQTVEVIDANAQLLDRQNASVHSTEQAFKNNSELTLSLTTAIEKLKEQLENMLEHKNQATMAIQSISAISEQTAASAEEVSATAQSQQNELFNVSQAVMNVEKTSKELQEAVQRFTLN
ncbi:methyl-accepting chemotaxis protein [Metasolibacillus fluoroglycofenilyticus]|uniref:methyl-accepting chemotaxis protein n=1 Tax=Metasolibacillus fluoroglycofenilyticus TaxID=1239396 RepID=UPI000D3334E2|nr:methyl-accepting chemotaxis protein [Metasolibacillus fluoroglycofenilyticus]